MMGPDNQGNFLGYSRGEIPNTAAAGLFQDATALTTAGVKATNDIIVENARRDITQAADEVRDATIHRLGAPAFGGPQRPADIDAYAQRIGNLAQARQGGTMAESHYWAMLDIETRRIRQKYPGHRREVDQIMQEVVGANPANRLIAELRQEATTSAGNAQREHEYWLREGTRLGAPSAVNYAALTQRGQTPSTLQLQHEAAQIQARDRAVASEKADIELGRARGEQTTQRAARSAQNDLYSRAGQHMASVSEAIANFDRRIEEQRRNPTANASQLSELRAVYDSQIRGPLMNILNETLHTTRPGQPEGSTWSTLIGDRQQIDGISKTYTEMVDRMGEAIGRGDWSLFQRLKTQLDAYQNASTVSLLNHPTHGQTFQNLMGLREILGPNFYQNSEFINRIPQMQRALREVFSQDHEDGIINNRPLSDTIERRRATHPNDVGTLTHNHIRTLTTDMSKPDVTDQGLTRMANRLFGEGNQNFLQRFTTGRNTAQVYHMVAGNRALHENMQRIRYSNPTLYNSYQQWVVNGFGLAARQVAANISEFPSGGSGGAHIAFNPDNNTFIFTGGRPGQDTDARRDVAVLNQAIGAFTSFLQSQGSSPEDARIEAARMIQSIGVRTGNVPGQSILNRLGQAASRALGLPPDISGPLSPEGGTSRDYSSLLNLIGSGEGGRSGYNAVVGESRPREGLSNMTLSDVLNFQVQRIGEGQNSAVGRYQFIGSTLRRLVNKLSLDPQTIRFTPDVQNRLAVELLREAGLENHLNNPTDASRSRLINRLSGTWAALPNSTGRGTHDGVGNNRANVPLQSLMDIITELERTYSPRRS